MSLREWPAEDYVIGSYIQATVADMYLIHFQPEPNERILDIGCGDGHYSLKILSAVPDGSVMGMDASQRMINLAKENARSHENFQVQHATVENMPFNCEFDHVVSFWCLQWTKDITATYDAIYRVLKPGGRIFTLFPSGDDAFMLSYRAVKQSGQFPVLDDFVPTMHYSNLDNLAEKLSHTRFSSLCVKRETNQIELPSLDFFRRFVKGIGFYQGLVVDETIDAINEAMVTWYDDYCQKQYDGKYIFTFSPYWVTGKK